MGSRVGGSLTGITVRRNESVAVAVPSLTVTVMRVVPVALREGSSVTVRLAPAPLKRMFVLGRRVVLLEVPLKARLRVAVSTSPMVNGTVIGVSSFVCWFRMSEMVGRSLTGLTVRTNELLEVVPAGSWTVMMTVAVPFWFAAGTSVTVRLEALPPKLMAESGNKDGFDDSA